MHDFLLFINNLIWDSILIYLLAGAGIWFTWHTGYIPLRHLYTLCTQLRRSVKPQRDGLSALQALLISLAARVGVGSLSGVAMALAVGGPGAIFWMWATGIIGMGVSFAECTLAQLYKTRNDRGQFQGGPAWYMERGLGMRWMGILFAVMLIIAFGFIANYLQASAISQALQQTFDISPLAISIALFILCVLAIRRGIQGVATIALWLVPIMCLCWLVPGLGVMLWHIDQLPSVLGLVIRSAFGWNEVAAGTLGYTLSQALSQGFQYGMYSNEAGIGSTPNVAAAAVSWPPHPAAQGLVQMLGVAFETLVLCSITAMIILLSGVLEMPELQNNGITILRLAMVSLTGEWSSVLVTLIIILFAFTTIIANVVYAENNLNFMVRPTTSRRLFFRLCILFTIVAGCLFHIPGIWQLAGIITEMMAIINLAAILLLSPVVQEITGDWRRQRALGKMPIFNPERFPEIHNQLAPGAWDNAKHHTPPASDYSYRS
ncbi:amino acid carrier protein [Erwinia sp. CPCC 100877]|nr:amino acid carrier protein [Erwinia sp. CPCC 100877]